MEGTRGTMMTDRTRGTRIDLRGDLIIVETGGRVEGLIDRLPGMTPGMTKERRITRGSLLVILVTMFRFLS